MFNEKAFQEERLNTIGGSDIAALFGVGYHSIHKLYEIKKRIIEPDPPTDRMLAGIEFEPAIARVYERIYDQRLIETIQVVQNDVIGKPGWLERINPETGGIAHGVYPWMVAHVDRFVVDGTGKITHGLEIKNHHHFMRGKYGEPGTDQIPEGFIMQNTFYMMLTALTRWDHYACFGGNTFELFTVEYDHELAQTVLDKALEFKAMLDNDTPPPADETDDARDMLWRRKEKLAADSETKTMQATSKIDELVRSWLSADAHVRDYNLSKKLLSNQLSEIMANRGVDTIEGPEYTVTWKMPKASLQVNWEGIATPLMRLHCNEQQRGELMEKNTSYKKTSPRFNITTRKGKADE